MQTNEVLISLVEADQHKMFTSAVKAAIRAGSIARKYQKRIIDLGAGGDFVSRLLVIRADAKNCAIIFQDLLN